MIRVVEDVEEFRDVCAGARARGHRVGLVPTMGALHAGHLDLVRVAREQAQLVAASIFVNPTQFGPSEDLARYPRDLDGDVKKLAAAGASVVFAPTVRGMYPAGEETRVRVGSLAEHLCGPKRPNHFEGVATVVSKLFAITGPCVAVFGRKDYQQLAVIRRFARDLFLPVSVVGVPTVREVDGLAMSSRNAFLSPEDRARAVALVVGLRAAAALFAGGERRAGILRKATATPVGEVARAVDYVSVADPDSLATFDDDALVGDRALVAIAAFLGGTRLIDNLVLGEDLIP